MGGVRWWLVVCTLAGCVDDAQVSEEEQGIFGGQVATAIQFPQVVEFHAGGGHTCSGTMITKSAILTAAHCVCPGGDQTCDLEVIGDDVTFQVGFPDETDVPIVGPIIVHPDFYWSGGDAGDLANDYAVLRVDFEESFVGRIHELDDEVSFDPIPPSSTQMAIGETGTFVGYGGASVDRDECTGNPSQALDHQRRFAASTLDDVFVQNPLSYYLEFDDPAHSICHGVSGGPVLDEDGLVAGVASFTQNDSSLFATADAAYDWLRDAACPHYDLMDRDAEQCTEFCPCATGESDCDAASECETGTMCALDVGKATDLDPSWDVCWSTAQMVRVYANTSYGGAMQGLPAASWGGAELGTVGDNAISSLRVPAGLTARLCAGATGAAPCQTFTTDTSSIGGTIVDQVSYVAVYPGVRLYTNPGYGGVATTLREGTYTFPTGGIPDNSISSLKATPGVHVRLCDGAGGTSCHNFWGNQSTLPSTSDNRTSFVAVSLGATLYTGEDYTGDAWSFPVGTFPGIALGTAFGAATSIVVAPGRRATVCDHGDGTGVCRSFDAGWYSFVGFNLDDRAAYLKVEAI